MKSNDFDNIVCPIADVLGAMGDKWAGLVLRDLFLGKSRYAELSEGSNITHATLSSRLKTLENNGLIEKQLYQTRPDRYEYRLTAQGRDLAWVMLALAQVGEKWNLSGWQTPPLRVTNRHTGSRVRLALIDEDSGVEITPEELAVEEQENA